jgi:hypothetical protein
MSLTDDQLKYLQERGFELIEGGPNPNEAFPYVTLNKRRVNKNYEISYIMSKRAITGTDSAVHPSFTPQEKLVELIEEMVARCNILDNREFTTQPGQKIKIFMTDPAWKETVETLLAKYK